MEIDNREQYLIIGCLNTVRLLAEKNVQDLEQEQHKRPLREFERLALLRLKSEVEDIKKLHDKIVCGR